MQASQRHTMLRSLAILMICAFAASPRLAHSTDPWPQQVQQLRTAIEQLQQARREFDAAREAHQQQVQQLQRNVEQLQQDRRRVQSVVQRQRQEVARLTAESDSTLSDIRRLQQQLAALADAAQPAARAMLDDIQSGIPFQRDDRLATITSAQQQLADADVLQRADGIQALAASAGEQLPLIRTSNVVNTPLLLKDPARRVEGYQARLGLLGIYFMGEDGRTILAANDSREPQEVRNATSRKNILRLIRMLQGQAPPGIMNVPLMPVTEATP